MNKQTNSAGAFSLVEVALALGVAAFCLIAILGLLPAGLNTNQSSTRQTTANGILSAIVADLRATPGTSSQSAQFGISFQHKKTLYFAGDGTFSTSPGTNTIFMATVKFSGSGGGQQGNNDSDEGNGQNNNNEGAGTASFVDVKVTWPYSTAGDNDEQAGGSGGVSFQPPGGGKVETFVGLDRNPNSNNGNNGDHDEEG